MTGSSEFRQHLELLFRTPRAEAFRIVFPSFLVFFLFASTLYGLFLPSFERNFLESRKKLSVEVVNTARGILDFYETQHRKGSLSLAEAQRMAGEQIRGLRYGENGKDYFWINDLQPAMLVHPYRPDLENTSLGDYQDSDGKYLFRHMVELVARQQQGFVDYKWQWQDDPGKVVPKISHVQLFQPWGWVIGTGVYLDDVRREFADLVRGVTVLSALVVVFLFLLTLGIVRRGLLDRDRRRRAEIEIERHQAQLEELVEARTAELRAALDKVKTLRGFLPICASCKKIRNDSGYWQQIEAYIRERSLAEFSHGICPDCAQELYPEYWKRIREQNGEG